MDCSHKGPNAEIVTLLQNRNRAIVRVSLYRQVCNTNRTWNAAMSIEASYFSGETARETAVKLSRNGDDIEFLGRDQPFTRWSVGGMRVIQASQPGLAARLSHSESPGSRLLIHDAAFVAALMVDNKRLKAGYRFFHLGKVLGWAAAVVALFTAIGYVAIGVLPQKVAYILPDNWRNSAGEQVVKSLIEDAKRCQTKEGSEAIAAMVQALAEGSNDLPPISVEVYNLPVLNAFAAPGGRIIITHELIKEASTPAEITGVLAHEIGHVANRHPEVQLIRVAGLQVLIGAISGNTGGDIVSGTAGLAALLRYSREAETEADLYARETMAAGNVDTMGLKSFFEKLLKLEARDKPSNNSTRKSVFERIGNVFSTHPGTEERIKEIKPLPYGQIPITVMSESQWRALKSICG